MTGTGKSGIRMAATPLIMEASPLDAILLMLSPVTFGFDVPHGNGQPVLTIQGLGVSDSFLSPLNLWLRTVGYNSYPSGIGQNIECPETTCQKLESRAQEIHRETGQKLVYIGHSLGGMLARVLAKRTAGITAAVICIAAPQRGDVRIHPLLFAATRAISAGIALRGDRPLGCFQSTCDCSFVQDARSNSPPNVPVCSIFTRTDGFTDWRSCVDEGPNSTSVEIPLSSHNALSYSPRTFRVIAMALHKAYARPASTA